MPARVPTSPPGGDPDKDAKASTATPRTAAAAYVRMSTEHQRYSTDNQLDAIRHYAVERGFEIVRVYSDEGRSGLSIAGRNGLVGLLNDVRGGLAPFVAVLVYDVSRWGRFQNADEAAYHEFTCCQAGIAVHYCAEQFENDGSPVSAIVKSVKRMAAAAYSQDLSVKVYAGAVRLIQMGYKQGGPAGYGLRRMLVDEARTPKGTLERGQHKSIQTDRVVLVPGPPEEIAIVREIYSAFAHERKSESEIAATLNARGVLTDLGRAWTRGTVHEVLTNEKYVGNNVYGRTSRKLKGRPVHNPPGEWVRRAGAFEAVVKPAVFAAAQEIIVGRSQCLSDDEMLGHLRGLLEMQGQLSGVLIDEAEDLPSSAAYRHRFGSLLRAYRLIGYAPGTDYRFIEINRRLRRLHPEVVAEVIARIEAQGARVERDPANDQLLINDEFTVSLVLARCRQTAAGASRWLIRLEEGLQPDITVAVRMNTANEGILDYYLLPALDVSAEQLRLADHNGIYLDAYRFDNLEFLFALTRRTKFKEAA